MDVVGSEIGQKMRSAIKAKLTELGCYVDDELPDYVMVMVANKRTRTQMEDDLQLFLGDNTKLFVNWLHQVLKKLQEVTVTTPLSAIERETIIKEPPLLKEKKPKVKKDREKPKKADSIKKGKKKEREKSHRRKEEKKLHKSKKKSKHHESIRPNIPPLLMNIEKESEPSITDVFAGQILKSHGISLDDLKEDTKIETKKTILKEIKRPILPIIDPATITSQPDPDAVSTSASTNQEKTTITLTGAKEDQINEINEIEAKIEGLKKKLVEQLDSMSDDEDFLNIRTEAEELMNDFAEDVFQEISQQAPIATPPLQTSNSPSLPEQPTPKPIETTTMETIELNLPKRPVRERLGAREEQKKLPEYKYEEPQKKIDSPERFTPEREPVHPLQNKSAKSRLSDLAEKHKNSSDGSSDKSESSTKRLTSRVSVLESRRSRNSCASVVRVRPRPRVSAPASSLLLRAVADAHKSLLSIPPKVDSEHQKVKRALVRPMRRVGDPNIVIQVQRDERRPIDSPTDNISLGEMDSEDEKSSKVNSDTDKDEYVPSSITMKIKNTDYVPSRRNEGRTASRKDDSLIIETINIHNPTVDKDKNTQFIVTMDGYHPNAFLAKKLMTEGLLNDENDIPIKPKETSSVLKTVKTKDKDSEKEANVEKAEKSSLEKKRLSNESEESETNVIIKQDESKTVNDETIDQTADKRKCDPTTDFSEKTPVVKKRKASPIVFDVDKKEKVAVKERERTESVSSDNHVIVTTTISSHKYDAVPPLSQAERKLVWCRSFPMCRYGASCAFQHPRCKFAASCTRRSCPYSHAPNATSPVAPTISSHVVPSANYKTITTAPLGNMCKFYPGCANPACPFYHPKPCRYGTACLNKLECNFYHAELPKWRYPV